MQKPAKSPIATDTSADLLSLWQQLSSVQALLFQGEPASVTVTVSESTLHFHERGLCFYNYFLWTLSSDRISLSHLRYGPPIFLFDLIPTQPMQLQSLCPHCCQSDRYTATLTWNASSIHLQCRILGPNKNQLLSYIYT